MSQWLSRSSTSFVLFFFMFGTIFPSVQADDLSPLPGSRERVQREDSLSSKATLSRNVSCRSEKIRPGSQKNDRRRTRKQCESGLSAAAPKIVFNPLGCYGLSENPHFSKWGAKRGKSQIAAKARSWCPIKVKRIMVEAFVQRHHVLWVTEGSKPRGYAVNDNFIEVAAITRCDNDLYRTVGLHAMDHGRKTYYASTSEEADVKCGKVESAEASQ